VRRLLALVLIGLLSLGSTAPLVVEAQGTPSITITTPGAGGDVVPEGDDFATTVIGNPWDMSEAAPPDVDDILNVDSVSIANGIWKGVARNNDPQLTLLSRGYGQSDPCCLGSLHWKPNDGFINPINADKYHIVSVRMKLTGSGQGAQGQFFWYRSDNPLSASEFSNFFPVSDGWQTYTFDLKQLGALAGSWSGSNIRGLRFDPVTVAGVTIEIDWVRFLADSTTATAHTIQWQTANAPAGATVDLSCTDPNGVVCSIATNVPASQNSQDWNTFLVGPGTYNIVAQLKTNTVVASNTAKLTVNTAPQIQLTAPSRTSGPDFATQVLGNPWDFSDPADVQKVEFSSFQVANGILSGISTQSAGGPDVELSGGGRRIDTSKYHYLTFKYHMDLTDPSQNNQDRARAGWAARVLWWGPGGPSVDQCTSDWVPVEPYEFIYSYDLATAPVETTNGACGPQGKPWAQATNVTQFRFDPHEVPQPTGWALDYILLTGNQEASGSLTITWNAQDPNTGQNALVDLFYSTDKTGTNLTPIKTDLAASAGSYNWDTSGLAQGTYFVVARIKDGLNTIQRISDAPFNVVAAPTSCSPRPNIAVRSEASGDGRLKVTVTASSASNPLQSIRFDRTNGALIDIPGSQSGSTGNLTTPLPANTTSFTFFLRRSAAGQPATAQFTVVDGCGDWRTLAGGGASAPF